jgi:hypothetical protein
MDCEESESTCQYCEPSGRALLCPYQTFIKVTEDNESESLPIIFMRLITLANYIANTSLPVSFIWQWFLSGRYPSSALRNWRDVWRLYWSVVSHVQKLSQRQGWVESCFNQFNTCITPGVSCRRTMASACLVPVFHGQAPKLYSASGETLDK